MAICCIYTLESGRCEAMIRNREKWSGVYESNFSIAITVSLINDLFVSCSKLPYVLWMRCCKAKRCDACDVPGCICMRGVFKLFYQLAVDKPYR